jgi:vanillate O-demethylase ferredoxin subunit
MTAMDADPRAHALAKARAGRIPVRVRAIREEAVDIRAFELEALDGGLLPEVMAGAHVDVHLGPGLTRQYSLCNGPGPTTVYLLGVKREAASRGGSAAMHALVSGEEIEIGLPCNNFPLLASSTYNTLLAGGIGITPILSMAMHLAAAGGAFQLHYFVRSAEHAAFRGQLDATPLAAHTHLHLGLETSQTNELLQDILARPRRGSHCYICGPAPFITSAQAAAKTAGWSEAAIHFEHFKAPCADESLGNASSFDVILKKAGRTIHVGAEENIVQALAREGIAVNVS